MAEVAAYIPSALHSEYRVELERSGYFKLWLQNGTLEELMVLCAVDSGVFCNITFPPGTTHVLMVGTGPSQNAGLSCLLKFCVTSLKSIYILLTPSL